MPSATQGMPCPAHLCRMCMETFQALCHTGQGLTSGLALSLHTQVTAWAFQDSMAASTFTPLWLSRLCSSLFHL